MPLFAYPVKISRSQNGQLTGVHCPDLQYDIPLPSVIDNQHKLILYILSKLQNNINEKIQRHISLRPPLSMSHYSSNIRNTNAQDTWTNIYLNIDVEKGPLERHLPNIGKFNGIVFAFLLTVVSYFAVKFSSRSIVVAIIGTIFRTVMNLIAYYYSEAAGTSSIIGKIVDKHCLGTPQTMLPESDPNENPQAGCISSTFKIISKIGAGSTPLVASGVIAWTAYQENLALADKIQPIEGDIAASILRIIAIALAISSGYLNVTFFMSFLPPVFTDLDKIANKLDFNNRNDRPNYRTDDNDELVLVVNAADEVPSYGSTKASTCP